MKLIDTKNEASAFCLSVSLSIKYLRKAICGSYKKKKDKKKTCIMTSRELHDYRKLEIILKFTPILIHKPITIYIKNFQ